MTSPSHPRYAPEKFLMRCTHRGPLVALVALLTTTATAADHHLTTIAGKKLTGKLVAVDGDGVTFQSSSSPTKISGKELLLVDLGQKVSPVPAGTKIVEIELGDGSRFRCEKFLIKGKAITATLFPGPTGVAMPVLEFPLTSVFSILRGAEDTKQRDEWKRLLLTRGKRDMYVIRQREGFDIVPGTLVEGTADGAMVTFEKEDGSRENLRLSRATGGLVFNHSPATQIPATACKVLDVFGNVLVAQAVELSDTGMKVTTVGGVVVAYPSLDGVAKLDYSQGNLAYLSDLTPQVDTPETPAEEASKNLDFKPPYIADKAPGNDPLRVDGKLYPKGLWIQPGTVLTYNIGGDYREFRVIVGIHDRAPDAGASVRVTIEADGRPVFSDQVRRKGPPKDLTLDVKNVKQLRILVDSETPSANGSQAVLGIAQVQK